jgi:hypothetical protein
MRRSWHLPMVMTAQQKIEAFTERVRPHLEELGIEAFVMVGYMKDADGKVSRITLGGTPGGNPSYEDGLRPMQILASKWGMGQL